MAYQTYLDSIKPQELSRIIHRVWIVCLLVGRGLIYIECHQICYSVIKINSCSIQVSVIFRIWNNVLQQLNVFQPDPTAATQDLDPLLQP